MKSPLQLNYFNFHVHIYKEYNHILCERKATTEGVVLLKKIVIFTGKQLCWRLLLIKLELFLKRLQHRSFPMNIAKPLRSPMFVGMPY